jgi:hypothetical protein
MVSTKKVKTSTVKQKKPSAMKKPKKENDVREKISEWCSELHPQVEIQKLEYAKLIEETGEKKVIDATVIGHYNKISRAGTKGCLISELEFEEHQGDYSILKDMLMITIPLRKLDYWRNDIPQYYIKIDKGGIPFMVNFKQIYAHKEDKDRMRCQGKWTETKQVVRIVFARRNTKTSDWPDYVIVGWDNIFKELDKVIRLAGF